MLISYIDDSGSEGKGPVFILAGYLSFVDIWTSFSAAWADCLKGPPELPYFKMREAKRLHDTFRGWSVEERDERLFALIDTVSKQPIMTALVFALWWDDYRRAISEFPEITDCHPYDMLFHGIMATTTSVLGKNRVASRIKFVFDDQGSAGLRAIRTYKRIREFLPTIQRELIVGSPELADDKVDLPLQAADLLAWQVRRYVAEKGSLPIEQVAGTRKASGLSSARSASVRPTPEHPKLARLLRNETVWREYHYAAIKEILEAWSKPIEEIFEG